jgi:fructokinase
VTLYGAVEVGGTKTDLTVGTSFDDMSDPFRFSTSDPDATLEQIIGYFAGRQLAAVGVASFGPLELDQSSPRFGTMLFTPKPGWRGASIHERLHTGLGVPVALDTDVNGAALGEGRWGAAREMQDYVYVTVGTGIGAGIVVAGKTIGRERHPEMGHISVGRLEDDRHEGTCPFHGDCLEGMTAGPALEARFGRHETWPGNDRVLRVAVHYLAQGMLNLVYTVAPERIVVGGGVSRLPGFHDRLRERLNALMAGYPRVQDLELLISAPGLGERSGLAGALILAESATG